MEKPSHNKGDSVEATLYIPLLNDHPHMHFEKNTKRQTVKIDWSTALPPINNVSPTIRRPL